MLWNIVILVSALTFTTPSWATDLKGARERDPSAVYTTTKTLYEVERCILDLDMPDVATVYRAPDQPDQSMIYYASGARRPMVVELKSAQGTTVFSVKNPVAKGYEKRFKQCE